MSYLGYLCLLSYGGVQHILCCVFICFSSSCVPYVVPVSQDCPFNLFCPFVVLWSFALGGDMLAADYIALDKVP